MTQATAIPIRASNSPEPVSPEERQADQHPGVGPDVRLVVKRVGHEDDRVGLPAHPAEVPGDEPADHGGHDHDREAPLRMLGPGAPEEPADRLHQQSAAHDRDDRRLDEPGQVLRLAVPEGVPLVGGRVGDPDRQEVEAGDRDVEQGIGGGREKADRVRREPGPELSGRQAAAAAIATRSARIFGEAALFTGLTWLRAS